MELIFNGYNNTASVQVTRYDPLTETEESFPFEDVTSVEAYIVELDQTITTGIDKSQGDGILKFLWGNLGLPKGRYCVRLIINDPVNGTQILTHESQRKLGLRVL